MSQPARAAHASPAPRPQPEATAASRERRIRWERHPDKKGQLIVLDALTGHVIAVVRSLFEMRAG